MEKHVHDDLTTWIERDELHGSLTTTDDHNAATEFPHQIGWEAKNMPWFDGEKSAIAETTVDDDNKYGPHCANRKMGEQIGHLYTRAQWMAWKLAWPVGALVIYLWQTWIIEIIGRKRRLQNENMSLAPMTLARDGAGGGGDGAGDGGAPDTVPESSCSDGGSSQTSMVVQAVFGSLA